MCMWSFYHLQLFSGSGPMLKKIIRKSSSSCSSASSSLTQTWLSILDQPGSGRRQANGRLTQVLEHFKRNLLKTSVSKMLKSLHKRGGSAQHCCAQFSLWSFLLYPKQISRAILMTPPQERQTTSSLQQIKNNCYTKKGKKIKERTTEQTGINTEACILTWMQVVQPVHEKTTTTGWAFHFLLHVPLICELLVLYLLQCDWFFFLKKGLKKRKKLKSSIWEKKEPQS